jgi:formylglycine-generating enzyme required for sulfatase activity
LKEQLQWKVPGNWHRQLETPRHPVVNVSWYEAVAYSRWLSDGTGRAIHLPTSKEWETAAIDVTGAYPWGADEPTEERLNFDQHIGSTTPVGIYPRGAGPGGHLDLAGNVWEWCSDLMNDGRIVRGGGWFSGGKYTQSKYFYHFHPENRFHDLGFRVAEHFAQVHTQESNS